MADKKRLIDANALTDAIEVTDWYHISPKGYLQKGANSQIHTPLFKADDIFQALKDAPTVDAVEVVHGRWVYNTDDFTPAYRCSACGYNKPMIAGERVSQGAMNYCPNCGAKMDGDGNG